MTEDGSVKLQLALLGGLLWAAGIVVVAGGEEAASLERFKALEGEWVAAESGEMAHAGDLMARYHVTAAGSAVVEEVFPGTPHEMVTVYHLDGKELVLTHYCMNG